ncbi:MAG: helix-turn-helix domain-containing protein [Bacteroidaceae bacterium]|nr:helix-turn-helix domain-containing protein [Bacteroidaceae bacterium]
MNWHHFLTPVAIATEQKKEEYKEVISLLKRDYSVRNTAKLSSVSVSTVQRVKREFSL